MISNFIVYNQNGDILRTGSCSHSDLVLQAQPSEYVIEGRANDLTDYVDSNEIKPKTALDLWPTKQTIMPDGVDFAVIGDIPEGVFITWPDGLREEIIDGVVEFAATQPDSYELIFDGVKYLREVVTIEANY